MCSNSSIGRLRCREMLHIPVPGFSSVAWPAAYGNTAEETLGPLLLNENDKEGTIRFRLSSMGNEIEKAISRKPIHSEAKSVMHEFGLDPVNVINTKNILKHSCEADPQPIREEYQPGFLPVFYYRIDF